MSIDKFPASENLNPAVERAIKEAFDMLQQKKEKNLSDHASAFDLHSEAKKLRKIREAAAKFIAEHKGRIPDVVDVLDEYKKLPEEKYEDFGEVIETGGAI